jgi:hypothetical protein
MCHTCLYVSYLSPDTPTELLTHLSSSWTALLFKVKKQSAFETSRTIALQPTIYQSLRATDIYLAWPRKLLASYEI